MYIQDHIISRLNVIGNSMFHSFIYLFIYVHSSATTHHTCCSLISIYIWLTKCNEWKCLRMNIGCINQKLMWIFGWEKGIFGTDSIQGETHVYSFNVYLYRGNRRISFTQRIICSKLLYYHVGRRGYPPAAFNQSLAIVIFNTFSGARVQVVILGSVIQVEGELNVMNGGTRQDN